MGKALRNTRCELCFDKVPSYAVGEGGMGRTGVVPIRVCRRCQTDPDAGLKRRRAAQQRAAASAAARREA